MLARCLELHYKTVNKLMRDKRDAERSGEYRVAARLHAVLLNNDGKASGEIAAILQSPRSCVSAWLKNYEEHGYEGLLEGHRSGRVPRLSPSETTALGDIIESGPVAYGFLSGVWTSPMITRVIREEFDQKYHPGHVRKLLVHIGFSVQRPKRLLAKADVELQNRWRRYTYPNIKKKRTTKGETFSSKTKPVSDKTRRSIKPGRGSGTNP
jgi:transposase